MQLSSTAAAISSNKVRLRCEEKSKGAIIAESVCGNGGWSEISCLQAFQLTKVTEIEAEGMSR